MNRNLRSLAFDRRGSSFFQHRLHPLINPSFTQVDRHYDQFITCRSGHVQHKAKLGSPIIHVTFEVGEEPVEGCSLPDLLRGRDVDAPLREMEEDFGGEVTGDRGLAKGVEGRGIESVDALGHSPDSQSTQNADVMSLVWGVGRWGQTEFLVN